MLFKMDKADIIFYKVEEGFTLPLGTLELVIFVG